jgi:electron transport complex protein RnfG
MERYQAVRDILKLSIVLTLVALVAGLAIALTNEQTAETIKMRKKEAQREALDQVFPGEVEFTEKAGQAPVPSQYWVARADGETIGYAFECSNRGYSSFIRFMIGVAPDGRILGMRVLSQAETPGLGTRVAESVSKKYIWNGLFGPKDQAPPWFSRQFVGLDVNQPFEIDKQAEWHTLDDAAREKLQERNAVTAITGATISTRAVTDGVERCARRSLRAVLESGVENQDNEEQSEQEIEQIEEETFDDFEETE